GEVAGLERGLLWEDSDLLVVEADESDQTFVALPADVAVVTSVEPDHLEHYGNDFGQLLQAFDRFLASASSLRVVCADDPAAAEIGSRYGARTYGEAMEADYRIVDFVGDRGSSRFSVERHGTSLGEVTVAVLGRHNARNAAGAIATAVELGAEFDAAVRALAGYRGVARRVQLR